MAATDTAAASVTLTFNNNSGIDLVVAMVQGLTKGQNPSPSAACPSFTRVAPVDSASNPAAVAV